MSFPIPSMALVVEDDLLQRELLSEALKAENLDVIQCESAEAAEVIIARNGADLALIVTDVELAGEGDGLELARFAKERYPHVQLVVVSGKPRTPPPGVLFLEKPYSIPELLSRVRT